MTYIDFYNTHKNQVYSYFFYNLDKDISIAEDLTSDTFLKGFEKFENYDDSYKFSTWIFTIARNTLYDHYRRKKVQIPLNDETEITFDEFVKYEQDFDSKIDTQIHMDQVYTALEKIPLPQKDMIIMKYLEDLSTKEISDMTGKTEANVRKTLSRGFYSIQKILLI